MPSDRKTGKSTVILSYNGILCSNKKDGLLIRAPTWMDLTETMFSDYQYHTVWIQWYSISEEIQLINDYRSQKSGDLWWKYWPGRAQKYLLECRKVLYHDLGGGDSDVYKCRVSSRFKLSTLYALLLYGHLAWINNDKTHLTIKWIPGSVKEKQPSQLQKFLPRSWNLVKGGAFHQIHQSWHTM